MRDLTNCYSCPNFARFSTDKERLFWKSFWFWTVWSNRVCAVIQRVLTSPRCPNVIFPYRETGNHLLHRCFLACKFMFIVFVFIFFDKKKYTARRRHHANEEYTPSEDPFGRLPYGFGIRPLSSSSDVGARRHNLFFVTGPYPHICQQHQ